MGRFKDVLKEGLEGEIPRGKLELLPSGFQRVGDIGVLFLDDGLEGHESVIGKFVMERFGLRSVFRKGRISGELRKPGMKRIAGRANTTVHRENGCLFKIDVSRLMFSKGNSFERGRVAAGEGEDVVDMFAGIGYFCVPVAMKTSSCRVFGIEKNPVALRFLRENLRLNRIENVEVIEGDCRDVAGLKADRILMGYFPGTEMFLEKAFSFLRREGVIHFHNVCRRGELWRGPLGMLETIALENGYRLEKILHKRVVKQYSPCKVHVVVDGKFRKV